MRSEWKKIEDSKMRIITKSAYLAREWTSRNVLPIESQLNRVVLRVSRRERNGISVLTLGLR